MIWLSLLYEAKNILIYKFLVYLPMSLVSITVRFFSYMLYILSWETTLSSSSISCNKTENECLVSVLFIYFSIKIQDQTTSMAIQFLSLDDFAEMILYQNRQRALTWHSPQRGLANDVRTIGLTSKYIKQRPSTIARSSFRDAQVTVIFRHLTKFRKHCLSLIKKEAKIFRMP